MTYLLYSYFTISAEKSTNSPKQDGDIFFIYSIKSLKLAINVDYPGF